MNTFRVGFISVDTNPRECRCARVRVDGVDVTSRCFAADDEHGFADCYALNANGKKYLVTGYGGDAHAATERLTGIVEIDFPNGLD